MRKYFAAFTIALLCAGPAAAEPFQADDPLARFLFPPDKVLGHAQEIGLDDAQRKTIRSELQKAQSRFLDFQFEMQPETEKMVQLLQEKPVDEAKVLAQADRVMSLEREVKKTQLTLLIRIKNVLTPAQQAKVSELQKAEGK
jgi:Spy/CpxP family protein refolding chaperone